MAYRNTTRMGDYRLSLTAAPATPATPDITATRAYGRIKQGWAINLEQALADELGAFARWGWDNGRTETWAFTEIDRFLSAGLAGKGTGWGRAQDRVAVAFVQNQAARAVLKVGYYSGVSTPRSSR